MLIKRFIHPEFLFEGDAGGGGGAATTEPPASTDPPETGKQGGEPEGENDAVAKAYAKLRAAEKERDDAVKKATKLERDKMDENERLKAEKADAEAELAKAREELTKVTTRTNVLARATAKGFNDPEVALALLRERGVELDTDAKIDKALVDLGNEKKHLVGTAPPSGGPITPQTSPTGGNAGVNAAIRAAAGR